MYFKQNHENQNQIKRKVHEEEEDEEDIESICIKVYNMRGKHQKVKRNEIILYRTTLFPKKMKKFALIGLS